MSEDAKPRRARPLEARRYADPAARPRRFYYVSAERSDGRRAIVAGPYPTHEAAVADVYRVTLATCRVDDRAWWYAWGTAGSDEEVPAFLGRPEDLPPIESLV